VLLLRRTSSVVLMLASLLAWADADTPSLAVTRFALVVAAAAGLGVVLSYAGRRPVASAEPGASGDGSPGEQQLMFSLRDDG
jgi:hypothetical protein